MYGFRTHHQGAGHIRPLITSNSATRRDAEQTNPLGEGESDCELRPRPVGSSVAGHSRAPGGAGLKAERRPDESLSPGPLSLLRHKGTPACFRNEETQMPSAFSARDNAALTATCCACQKTTPTELMVSLTGNQDGGHKYYSVCLACAGKGWRPPGFAGVYQRQ